MGLTTRLAGFAAGETAGAAVAVGADATTGATSDGLNFASSAGAGATGLAAGAAGVATAVLEVSLFGLWLACGSTAGALVVGVLVETDPLLEVVVLLVAGDRFTKMTPPVALLFATAPGPAVPDEKPGPVALIVVG